MEAMRKQFSRSILILGIGVIFLGSFILGCANSTDAPVVRVMGEGGKALEDEVVLTQAEFEAQEVEERQALESTDNDLTVTPDIQNAESLEGVSLESDVDLVDSAVVTATGSPFGDEAQTERWNPDFFESMYRIGAGDSLGFRSFDDPSLNTNVIVRHDGYVSLPWVPDVRVAGLTRTEATLLLKEAYSELYYDPEVSLTILDASSQSYMVIGDVQRPAEYPYTRPITLLQGITNAGGLRINQRGGDTFVGGQGQLVKAFIIRNEMDDRQVFEYDLRSLQEPGRHVADTPVLPGDIVYIPEGINLVYVLGEINRQAIIPLLDGMTLLQLIANSGGLRESTARLNQVILMREMSDGSRQVMLINVRQMLSTGEDFLMEPGDIVYFPRRRMTNLQEFVGRITGTISPALNLASQTMRLYTQAYDTYYTKERFDRLFRDDPGLGAGTTLGTLQTLRDLSAVTGDLFPIIAPITE
jgi:protein involved in polysaccharide export with SLBB domain